MTFYKSFVRLFHDYGGVMHDLIHSELFHLKLESYQYDAFLAITGAINGLLREKLYQEPGLETL